MYIVLEQFLDFIFPPSEENRCVQKITTEELHQLYTPQLYDDIYFLSTYADTRMKALIHEAKFHGNSRAYKLLGTLLGQFLNTKNIPYRIIPIPLSKKRLRMRGYNQVEEVVRKSPLPPGMSLHTHILIRTRDTQPQTELRRKERLLNIRDAFGVADVEAIRGKHILIIDDVTTTGTTLHAAKAALLPYSPASITCVALAH